MTIKIVKHRTILAITFAFIISSMSLTPAFAHNPPYKDLYWFSTEDPELCYLLDELNELKVDGNKNQGASVKAEVEDAKNIINSAVSGLTIRNQGTTCDQNFIEIGAQHLGFFVLAEARTTVHGSNNEYLESTIDFARGYNWGIDSDKTCSIWLWDERDPQWLATHELGHALSLGGHGGSDHSMMKEYCTSKWSTIQTVDDSALEVRYS